VLLTICTMALAQDMPDGNYAALHKAGAMRKVNAWRTWKAAIGNYRYASTEPPWLDFAVVLSASWSCLRVSFQIQSACHTANHWWHQQPLLTL
jgi:hypothetical protein